MPLEETAFPKTNERTNFWWLHEYKNEKGVENEFLIMRDVAVVSVQYTQSYILYWLIHTNAHQHVRNFTIYDLLSLVFLAAILMELTIRKEEQSELRV